MISSKEQKIPQEKQLHVNKSEKVEDDKAKIRREILGDELHERMGPIWEKEREEEQRKTIEKIAEFTKELGIADYTFLLGGYASDIERAHADVDFVIQGEDAFEKLRERLLESGLFSETGGVEGASKKDFTPKQGSKMAHVDIRFTDKKERNGVVVWEVRIPEEIREELGKPFAIPDSAFGYDEKKHFGVNDIRIIYPEYTFLAKGDSPKLKDRYDKRLLKKQLDQERLMKIVEDTKKANVALRIPTLVLERVKESINKKP